MGKAKIALVGAGNIGGTLAHLLLLKKFSRVVLYDVMEGIPQGKALDLSHCGPIEGFDADILGTHDYADIAGSEVVIVTAGLPRKPGMSRDALLESNAAVMKSVGTAIGRYCPDAFIICVTNPLDIMVGLLHAFSGVPDQKIVGMAGVLDSARFRFFLAQALKVSVHEVQAYVLGGHGDSMVPLTGLSNVAGVSLDQLVIEGTLTQAQLDQIVHRTRQGGGEIVNLLKTGSAFYAPASAAIAMAESYLFDQKRILPVAARLSPPLYGIQEPLFLGVPAKIGGQGVEAIIQVQLTAAEQANLAISIKAVQELNAAAARLNKPL
jgi:malate dehydrogenase